MDFTLSDEQVDLRDAARRVAREVYAPRTVEWDRAGTFFPNEERKRLADLGFLGITLPGEVGGEGRELMDALIVIEEVAKECQIAAFPVFEANTGPARVIDLFGTDEQKARFLPPVISGTETVAVAISEPDAGSAATDLGTSARRFGDEFLVNGTKRWCSGAGRAERYLVYVRLTEDAGAAGIGAVIVDRETEGLRFGPQEQLMGMHGIPSADIFLEDARVPAENLIIPAGRFHDLFAAFSIERLGNATMSLAIAQACLDRSKAYVRQRRQFGKEIAQFQLVQAALADMVMAVEAARLLLYRAAANAGRSVPMPLEASIAKCFANETAKRVADLAVQTHGGYGYAVENGLERYLRDAHGWALAGGTTNIQRVRIAAEFLGVRFDQRQ